MGWLTTAELLANLDEESTTHHSMVLIFLDPKPDTVRGMILRSEITPDERHRSITDAIEEFGFPLGLTCIDLQPLAVATDDKVCGKYGTTTLTFTFHTHVFPETAKEHEELLQGFVEAYTKEFAAKEGAVIL
jgi:hypothetical protein